MRPGELAWRKAPHGSWWLNLWDGRRWIDQGAVSKDYISAGQYLKGWVVLTPTPAERKPFQPSRKPVAVFRTLAEAKAHAVELAEARRAAP